MMHWSLVLFLAADEPGTKVADGRFGLSLR